MDLYYLESVDSTHTYLKNHLATNGYTTPVCFYSFEQTDGIGSRNNSWIGESGNLFFSFAIDKLALPKDLPLQSASIYFSFLLKEKLAKSGSNIWLKWPNDFYIRTLKIGGTITNLHSNILLCGIGLNLKPTGKDFGYLDIKINSEKLLEQYFQTIKNKPTWKQIFSLYEIEFHKNKNFNTTIDGEKSSLVNAVLQSDGSIMIDNKKVYSLR